MKMKSRNKINLFIFLFISVAILLILYKINLLSFRNIIVTIKNKPHLIILSSLLYALSILLGSLRYLIILRNFNYSLKFNPSLKITSSSIFYGQWFPGSAALIEIFRIFFLKQFISINLKESIFSVFYDRVIGLISFIIICFFAISVKYELYNLLNYYFYIIVFFTIIFINKTPGIIFNFLGIKFKNKSFLFISYEMIISLLISGLIIFSYYLISKTTNAHLSYINIAIMMPIIAIIAILPIGIGNLGGLQVGTLIIFQFISEKNQEIVSMSLTFAVITIIINTIFGLFFLNSSLDIFKKALDKYETK